MTTMRKILVFSLVVNSQAAIPAGYHPIVVTGPLMGQSLEFLNADESSWCNTKGEWKWLWGNPAIAKSDVLCLLDSLRLEGWDKEEHMAIPKPKVQVRPKGGYSDDRIGGLEAIASFFGGGLLDGGRDGKSHLGPRMRALGYENDKSFIGHGYDWRLGVRDWQVSSFPVLRDLIENAVKKNGAKVVMTGISMSGPYTHAFLSWARAHDAEWPANHIHAFIPVGAPFNGAVMALGAVISSVTQTWSTEGECPHCDPAKIPTPNDTKDNLVDRLSLWFKGEIMDIADEVLKNVIWNWPSMYFMSTGLDYSTNPPTDPVVVTMANGRSPPECSMYGDTATKCGATETKGGWKFTDPKYLGEQQCGECMWTSVWNSCTEGYDKTYSGWTQNLCCKRHECDAKSYKASELPELLRKVGRPGSADMMEYALSVSTTTDPGVPVHCVFAHNIQTFTKLAFTTSEDLQTEQAMVTLDDGDQTVNSASAEVCTRWSSTVKVYRIPGAVHAALMDVDQVLDVIEAVATNEDQKWKDWKEPAMSDVKFSNNGTVAATKDLLIAKKKSFMNGIFQV